MLEAVLVAAAVGGLVVLRKQGLSAANPTLYPSAAPVLLAIPVAVIVLRCYPAAARALARIAGRSRGVVAFVGLARATRTPPGAALPAFALVLVLTMVAFAAMISASVTRGQEEVSWRRVGVDAIIQAPAGAAIPRRRATPDRLGARSHRHRERDGLPGAAGHRAGADRGVGPPARYAAVAGQAPGPRFPVAALSGTAARRSARVVPAAANAAAAQLLGPAPGGCP